MEEHALPHYKFSFLKENGNFTEIKPSTDNITVGKFQSIKEEDDEIWLLQCPKGTEINQLQHQKIKLPGRTTVNNIEAVAVEASITDEQVFGYCNRKGEYALRILPIRGSIIMRSRLKASDTVTMEKIEECCPQKIRVPAPNFIKLRHPLFGVNFTDKLTLTKNVLEKLKNADDNSTEVMREMRVKRENSRKVIIKTEPEESKVTKKKNRKRVINDSMTSENDLTSAKKNKKIKINDSMTSNCSLSPPKKSKTEKIIKDEEISPDLKWLNDL